MGQTDAEFRAEFEAAKRRGARAAATEPRAAAARYDRAARVVAVELTNGAAFSFPVTLVALLAEATDAQLAGVEVGPVGIALHWPALDEDLSVAGLVRIVFGGRAVARAFAADGGRARSEAKAEAARNNGAKGGRPRKNAAAAPAARATKAKRATRAKR